MNDDELTARWDVGLAMATTASPSALATLAVDVFAHAGGREHVVGRLAHPDFGRGAWRLAKWDVEEQIADGGAGWIDSARWWLEAGRADWRQSAPFCADVAWTARAARNSALLHVGPQDLPPVIETPGDQGLLHILLQSQRYDFRFRAIRETVASVGVALTSLDPFSRAIHAFALLAQNVGSALSEFEAVRQAAGDDEKVAHALLHGLWMATKLPSQANRIMELIESSDVLRDDDPIVALRKAYALRKLQRYDEAMRTLDIGVLHLSPASPDVHQDFARERAMVLVVQDIEESYGRERQVLSADAARHVRELERAVGEKADQIEQKVSESLFKMVEILALFTAVVALLASGAASVTIGTLQWWQRAVLMLTAGLVVMAFFFAIRIVVRPRRAPREPESG